MQVHANELKVPLMWAPAAFGVGHVSATWRIAEGEAIASQGHLCAHGEKTYSLKIRNLYSGVRDFNCGCNLKQPNAKQYRRMWKEPKPVIPITAQFQFPEVTTNSFLICSSSLNNQQTHVDKDDALIFHRGIALYLLLGTQLSAL